jgi:hypothetical protein
MSGHQHDKIDEITRSDLGGGGLLIVWSALLFLAGMQLGQERMADQVCA